ncbi:hypothetical protein HDU79_004639 [Rhizoclosmatium sp. JEL0117]|nr:hypothetical protein HDU79_004639 [Rhizoclosmatium sp. JEL0117]
MVNNNNNRIERHVAIIGAGLAGLVTARHFLAEGWNVTVFEAQRSLGGVWERAYPFAALQTPSSTYHFSDFPFPFAVSRFATKQQLLNYFSAYAAHFGVLERIQFGSRVVRIRRRDDGRKGWSLDIQRDGFVKEQVFDFVVSCQGLYSGKARIPDLPGRETFGGPILHSSELIGSDALQQPNVAILGSTKTAIDCITNRLANVTEPTPDLQTHMIFRKATWFYPNTIAWFFDVGILNNHRFTYSSVNWLRLITNFFNIPSAASSESKVGSTPSQLEKSPLLSTNKTNSQQQQQQDTLQKHPSPWFLWAMGYKPTDSILPTYCIQSRCGSYGTQPPRFFDYFRSGLVKTHGPNLTISHLSPRTIHLSNTTTIENVDALVLATGYHQTMVLPEGSESLIENGGVFLYRNVVHPSVPDFAFVGTASSLTCITTSMSVHWLMALLRGDIDAPTESVQWAEIQRKREMAKNVCGDLPYGAGGVDAFPYLDSLCEELGVCPVRKVKRAGWWALGGWNPLVWIWEAVGEYVPADYRFDEIEREIRDAAEKRRRRVVV